MLPGKHFSYLVKCGTNKDKLRQIRSFTGVEFNFKLPLELFRNTESAQSGSV